MLNILCILTMTLCIHTWAMAYLDLDTIPWGNDTLSHEDSMTEIVLFKKREEQSLCICKKRAVYNLNKFINETRN